MWTIGTYVGGWRKRGQNIAGKREGENHFYSKACYCHNRVSE